MGFGTLSPASRMRMPSPPQNRTTFIVQSSAPGSSGGAGSGEPEGCVEAAGRQEILDATQANVSFEPLGRQPLLHAPLVQLLHATPHGPFRGEPRDTRCQFVAVDAITSRIRATALAVL